MEPSRPQATLSWWWHPLWTSAVFESAGLFFHYFYFILFIWHKLDISLQKFKNACLCNMTSLACQLGMDVECIRIRIAVASASIVGPFSQPPNSILSHLSCFNNGQLSCWLSLGQAAMLHWGRWMLTDSHGVMHSSSIPHKLMSIGFTRHCW